MRRFFHLTLYLEYLSAFVVLSTGFHQNTSRSPTMHPIMPCAFSLGSGVDTASGSHVVGLTMRELESELCISKGEGLTPALGCPWTDLVYSAVLL